MLRRKLFQASVSSACCLFSSSFFSSALLCALRSNASPVPAAMTADHENVGSSKSLDDEATRASGKKRSKKAAADNEEKPVIQQQQQAASTAPKLPCNYQSFVASSSAKLFLQQHFPESKSATTHGESSGGATTTTEQQKQQQQVSIGGRVVAVRDMGKLIFITINNDGDQLQILYSASEEQQSTDEKEIAMATANIIPTTTKADVKMVARSIKAGDIIGAVGVPGITRKGEPSLFAHKIELLTKYVQPSSASSSQQLQQQENSNVTCPSLTGFSSPSDPEMLYRYRFIDLMCNSERSQKVFRTRAKVITALRTFLDARGFVEVETPVFHTVPAGAAARPFKTHHDDNDSELFLRIAPELYLKQCVVGGMDRVYEIGRVFRNEGSDRSHNPEFTSCEFYQAFATYKELMTMTEELVRALAAAAAPAYSSSALKNQTASTTTTTTTTTTTSSSLVFEVPRNASVDSARKKRKKLLEDTSSASTEAAAVAAAPDQKKKEKDQDSVAEIPTSTTTTTTTTTTIAIVASTATAPGDHIVTIDFSAPFRTVDILTELEAHLGLQLPRPISMLDSAEGADFLAHLLKLHDIPMPQPASPAKLFDKLIDHFITDDVVQPTFVTGHPVFMSPLAKEDPQRPGVSERFELFVNGMEICNAYSELNDPLEQKRRFEQQLKQRILYNDTEAQCVDETFLKALQVGLPPTAGWGMGIDRMVMLLCGATSIRDVVLFPLLRQKLGSDAREAKRRRASAACFEFDPFMTKFCLNSLEAELLRRGGHGAHLVRSVHEALDSICSSVSSSSPSSSTTTTRTTLTKNGQTSSSSSSITVQNTSGDGNKNNILTNNFVVGSNALSNLLGGERTPDCSIMALVLLCGLRGTEPLLRERSEEKLLDLALSALCDPAIVSARNRWWWG